MMILLARGVQKQIWVSSTDEHHKICPTRQQAYLSCQVTRASGITNGIKTTENQKNKTTNH
jgi:hypothetical protein